VGHALQQDPRFFGPLLHIDIECASQAQGAVFPCSGTSSLRRLPAQAAWSLSRYITRPALSDARVQINAAGPVELTPKTPWRDGTTHLVMSPLEFMQRLVARVCRLRLHPPLTDSRLSISAVQCPVWVERSPSPCESRYHKADAQVARPDGHRS